MAALLGVASYSALAQDMDQTGSGRGRASAAGVSSGAHAGRRVPHPNVLGPNETGSIQRRTPSDRRDDAISRGICIGCSPQ
ncbi:hypothetical protein CIW48_06155 [Methylobacterium sp. P1-11]|nr:hypothetical protein CIW48_06155 [Methylobacterium sp. P1-11]